MHGGAVGVVVVGSHNAHRVADHTYDVWRKDSHDDVGHAEVDVHAWKVPSHACACHREGACERRGQPCDDVAFCHLRPHHQHHL